MTQTIQSLLLAALERSAHEQHSAVGWQTLAAQAYRLYHKFSDLAEAARRAEQGVRDERTGRARK
jgi:glycerol kinase